MKKTKTKAPPKFDSKRPQKTGASPSGWHSIADAVRCPKEYELRHVYGVRRPSVQTPDALGVGNLFHQGRAKWFIDGFPTGSSYWRELQDYIYEAALNFDLPVRDEAITNTLKYLDQYCTYWSARVKPRVKAVEHDISGPLIPGFPDRTARLDDVSEYAEANWGLCIGELKTTSVSVKDVVEEYTVHGQTIGQSLIWETAKEGQDKFGPVEFIMLDIVVKGYGKEKCQFGRQPIRITPFMKNWYIKMLHVALATADALKQGDLVAGRNITACTRIIGRYRVACEFRDLCQRGKSAAVGYVTRDGSSLATIKDGALWD